ncbi:MAG: LacI family transcriptional regulator [Treponema sp.]|jgi:LacI family transcriptional regulator|nr:LacI family transcriptional regulator [Treponema sp.]
MRPKKNTVTLKNIARVAGISVAAVSKALHNKPDISTKTVTKVRQIVKDLGYHPNIIARSLRTGKTNIIGVIIPDNCNSYNALVLKGVEETLQKRGYTALLGNSNENAAMEEKLLRSMISVKVDGILIIPVRLQNCADVNIPLVFMSRSPYLVSEYTNMDRRRFSFVVNDDRYGEYLATRHLVERGYRNIYLLVGNDDPKTVEGCMNRARIEGYKQALTEANLSFHLGKIKDGIVDVHQSYLTALDILRNDKAPIAFCTTTDYNALGVISALNQSGLDIPREAAVVGYDDIDLASYITPQLTTICQEKYTIGSRSAECLIEMIEGNSSPQQTTLQPTLAIRFTT